LEFVGFQGFKALDAFIWSLSEVEVPADEGTQSFETLKSQLFKQAENH
jgi:hypothetical protein